MGPGELCVWVCVAITAAVWVASLITNEHSWTDRIWSIAPIAYTWIFATLDPSPRLTLMACLVTAWGVRLTFNFARKGGYAPGGEDYRWAYLRRAMPGWAFQAFNLLFIAIYQNALILGMTLPVATAASSKAPLSIMDWALAAAFLAALIGETVADQQQWDFHRRKAVAATEGREVEPSYLDRGLFAYSRHPNYFFEQLQWWVFYGFAVSATGAWLHATILGPVLLTLLFIGSTVFTERISVSRHPDYPAYQARVSALIPLPAKSRARV